jgi:tetratricopeptide (TPR) repeat protein
MPKRPIDKEREALLRAQELAYDAWGERSPARRAALARAALELSPLCADAHVILAQTAKPDSDDAIDHWRRGVEAGAAAIGAQDFASFAGEFWGFIETRPYMRARLGLAVALWRRGRRTEAVGHMRDMLALNPNDNQGIRYVLAHALLERGDDSGIAALLSEYPDEVSTHWSWTKALAAFRRVGDGEASRTALAEARGENRHVAGMLIADKRPQRPRAMAFEPGGRSEAIDYVADAWAAWRGTPGAVDWLAAAVKGS